MKINIFVRKGFNYIYRETIQILIWYFAAYFPLFPTLMGVKVRAKLWRLLGAKVGKDVFIGYGVYCDVGGMKRLIVEDHASIMAESLILLHRRDISKYNKNELQHKLPMIEDKIHIKRNASIGMRSIIMPGITIGEGAVIGSSSIVTKDIPSYSIAVGNPAKIIKTIN